jgi:hypothetical protein
MLKIPTPSKRGWKWTPLEGVYSLRVFLTGLAIRVSRANKEVSVVARIILEYWLWIEI